MTKPPISYQKAPASHLVCLGVITTAHGIRGAIRIKTFTESPENLTRYGSLQDDKGNTYKLKVLDIKQTGIVTASITGITTRNEAEALRGTSLYIERDRLPTPKEEEFYHLDLIGLVALDLAGDKIGVVETVHNFGAGDLLEIKLVSGQLQMIPFRLDSVPTVDVSGGTLTIDPSFLLDNKAPAL